MRNALNIVGILSALALIVLLSVTALQSVKPEDTQGGAAEMPLAFYTAHNRLVLALTEELAFRPFAYYADDGVKADAQELLSSAVETRIEAENTFFAFLENTATDITAQKTLIEENLQNQRSHYNAAFSNQSELDDRDYRHSYHTTFFYVQALDAVYKRSQLQDTNLDSNQKMMLEIAHANTLKTINMTASIAVIMPDVMSEEIISPDVVDASISYRAVARDNGNRSSSLAEIEALQEMPAFQKFANFDTDASFGADQNQSPLDFDLKVLELLDISAYAKEDKLTPDYEIDDEMLMSFSIDTLLHFRAKTELALDVLTSIKPSIKPSDAGNEDSATTILYSAIILALLSCIGLFASRKAHTVHVPLSGDRPLATPTNTPQSAYSIDAARMKEIEKLSKRINELSR